MLRTLKQVLRTIFYQLYYYVLGSSAMLEDFVYRRSNKIVIRKLPGKVAVVTGGARGLGVEIVKALMQGDVHVIIGCRNAAAGEKTIEMIRSCGVDSGSAEVVPLDLMSLKSVHSFAQKVLDKHRYVHYLVNNAGIMFVPFKLTEDNIESHFAVNYLSHCLLTHLLLPALKNAGQASGKNSRVVNVSSCAYLAGTINFLDLNMKKGYIPQAAYAQSKLAQILFSNRLHKLLKDSELPIQVHSVHPGIVNTELFNETALKKIAPFVPALLFKTPAQGASSVLYATTAEDLEGTGGNYISNCHVSKLKPPATDIIVEQKLWSLTLDLAGIENFNK